MDISALASGSSGNCYYIEHDDSAILVDAGISCKQIIERLSGLKKGPEKIQGIFISHEHSDHIRGADVFARKFNVPIFATQDTMNHCLLCQNHKLIKKIEKDQLVKVGGMKIRAFSKSHDAADPVSFTIKNDKKISVITDVGKPCKNVIKNIADSDLLCLESNHDEVMLEEGPYPYYLKKRIMSDTGHLSNIQASLCCLEHANPKLKHVILAHLSQTNNSPALAFQTFTNLLKERSDLKPKVHVSNREFATDLFQV
jgi:phosphoribosyl 1,2-cyclic phosphodiesterase